MGSSWWVLLAAMSGTARGEIDFRGATVVTRGDLAPLAERTAALVLVEEVEKRTGIRWKTSSRWPDASAVEDPSPIVAVTSVREDAAWSGRVPELLREQSRKLPKEGFRLLLDSAAKPPVVWIVGADPRGALFGVGEFLRKLALRERTAGVATPLDVTSAPAYPIRGHQLGYRNRANSYDAWDEQQYERYIRELAMFGANAVENIPFEDESHSPHMRVSRAEMNVQLSRICQRYDLDYWLWTPATVDLADPTARAALLLQHEGLYQACPRIDAIFVPGGDPGRNHSRLVMPFLADLADRLGRRHPQAKVWLSLQGFDAERVDAVYTYLDEHTSRWFGGIVHGPSSPDLRETRRRLAPRYPIRHYPDITHCVRCQYPVPWWDPAFAFTLGREPINPRPVDEAVIHNAFADDTAGFVTYSDGVHDDVNKVVWTRLGWDPDADVREILIEYASFFFGPDVADDAADGILALERNWQGPLAHNGGVDATLSHWQRLEQRAPRLGDNWRWQQCLLRACYDAYTRHRLIWESRLEDGVNAVLARAAVRGPQGVMDDALAVLRRADIERVRPDLRARIEELGAALFRSIGLQTSVPRFKASGAERGAVLDYLDYPLNNRWWLEDQLAAIRQITDTSDKLARLERIRTWERPGPGSFYDDIGNVAKSPRVIRGEGLQTDPLMIRNPNPDFWEGGRTRGRQSWFSKMDWPIGMRYEGLDPLATYVVRLTGFRDSLLRIDGQRVSPTIDGKDMGEFKEFPVPPPALADGILTLTWDQPQESHLNWREQSRLTEVWLLRR